MRPDGDGGMSGHWALSTALRMADLIYRRPLLRAAADPRRAQTNTLLRIISANADTTFGREHGFSGINALEAYRSNVPVSTYEDLAPAIKAQADQALPTLTREAPVFYARTSGTTGPARDFPVTATAIGAQKRAQRILAASMHRGSSFFRGHVAAFGGGYIEGHLPSGQPFGSASGQTFATTPAFLRRRFVVPSTAYSLETAAEKYHLYALSALASPDVTGLIAANPSTILSILRHIQSQAETVLRDLRDGTFTVMETPSEPALQAANEAMTRSPDQAKRLEQALKSGLRLDEIWPRLGAIASWIGGNCSIALESLAPHIPPHVKRIEIGYRASEFIGTINVDVAANLCLPPLEDTVFEFVEQDRWENDEQDFLWLDQLEQGRRYYVFATTASGLYRYAINDVVEVVDRFKQCPALAFVQKGAGVTNITGEKLHEAQLLEAIGEMRDAIGLPPGFCLAIADPEAAVYRLYHAIANPPAAGRSTAAAEHLDQALSRLNVEYAAKRASDRLRPADVVFLKPGADEALKRHLVAQGRREAQYKPPALVDGGRFGFDFAPYHWSIAA